MSPRAFGISRIGQISMRSSDIDRSIAFYRDRLGARFLFQVPDLAFFDFGGVRLMLTRPESAEFDHPGSVVYFDVDDIVAAHRALEARSVLFEGPPHKVADLGEMELWMAFFRDPDRNLLAIMSEVPRGEDGRRIDVESIPA